MPFYYGSGTVINYGSDSDFLTSHGSYGSGSGSTTLPGGEETLPEPGHGDGNAALEEVVLQVGEVVLLDDVRHREAAEHVLEDLHHGGRALPARRHGVSNL